MHFAGLSMAVDMGDYLLIQQTEKKHHHEYDAQFCFARGNAADNFNGVSFWNYRLPQMGSII